MTLEEQQRILSKCTSLERELSGMGSVLPPGAGLTREYGTKASRMRRTVHSIRQWALAQEIEDK